jgi:NADH dehydrogenase
MGSVANYFGIQGLEEYSFGVKSFEQIKRFKKHLHDQLVSEGRPDLNYVIVGAGPTGIELAGALPDYLHKIMKKHGVHGQKPQITLIEAAARLLPRSPEKVSKAVEKRLQKLGITLKVNQKVEGLSADNLMVNGEPIHSHTVVWTAGTANHPFFKENNFGLTERGKVIVDDRRRYICHWRQC